QVLITGNSRFGRVRALPSCVACDRPLRDKGRSRDTTAGAAAADLGRVAEGLRPRSAARPLEGRAAGGGGGGGKATAPARVGMPAGALREDSSHASSFRQDYDTATGPTTAGGVVRRDGSGGGSGKEGQYVLRSGFKMPRQGSAAAMEHSQSHDQGVAEGNQHSEVLLPVVKSRPSSARRRGTLGTGRPASAT
ncbi:unnamed protein product, partial [Chrysoparadoxa australica]